MQDTVQHLINFKRTEVWCVSEHATVSQAAHQMQEHAIGTLVVVGHKQPVGMLSEHEIVARVLACDKDPSVVRVSAIMTSMLVVDLQTSIEAAAALALQRGAPKIAVVDAGRIIALISIDDIAAWTNRQQAFCISDLNGYITGHCVPPSALPGNLSFDEPPILEVTCAYCGATDDQSNWDLGIAICQSCVSREQTAWTPFAQ